MIGEKIGRYRVEALLGRGGMGQVYRAVDEELGRAVAIKLLAPDADGDLAARMRREARAASALSHPNAATVFDVGEHAGKPFIVMELCEGDSARALVGRRGAVEPKVKVLRQVAEALAAAHERGLVHRDVKPDNVVVSTEGNAKLLDFGVAKIDVAGLDPSSPTEPALAASLTKTGTSVGSPAYMAPEQLRGEPVDGRADQFSWGVTAFELLSGRLPWKSATSVYDLVGSILHEQALRLADVAPEVPPRLAALVDKAMSKDRASRYASMREVLDELTDAGVTPAKGEAVAPSIAAAGVTTHVPSTRSGADPAAPREPARRAVPWSVIAPAIAVAIGGTLLIRDIVKPPPGTATTGSSRGPILGLDDEATKRAEAELMSLVPSAPASAASASTSGAPASLTPVLRCEDSTGCAKGNDAWCDLAGKRLGCCAPGLVSTPEGRCTCPPGGVTSREQIDNGCKPATVELKDEVRAKMRAAFPKLVVCYETALKKTPKLKGDVSLSFSLDSNGVVQKSSIAGSSAPDPDFQDCLLAEVKKLTFSPPADGKGSVTYPLQFSPD
ncbi:MAG: TonB family protein [Polyangiaceae bacterium]|jgi:TonB family protein|nr:TonB family protein [Polyangiaceae bacterium]MBK8941411.1 TonB family protein [Polyangiaceae bacterium]